MEYRSPVRTGSASDDGGGRSTAGDGSVLSKTLAVHSVVRDTQLPVGDACPMENHAGNQTESSSTLVIVTHQSRPMHPTRQLLLPLLENMTK